MSQNETDLQQKLNLINIAREFEKTVATKGWSIICAFQTEVIQKALDDMKRLDTSGPEAVDALRRWQIAVTLTEGLNSYIQQTLDEAKILSGAFTMDDVLLMEKLKNEQPDPRPDPAGY